MRALSARRRIAAAIGVLLVLVAAVAGLVLRDKISWRAPNERPELLLLTSLPIVFPEKLTLDSAPSPILDALSKNYRPVPVSLADEASLSGHRLLLMAQPQAQPGEVLVELDQWVRSGGRVLLLADPVLEWPTDVPLGDSRRPPSAFADTGLLGHWGLRLDSPDRLGPASFTVGGRTVHALSAGTLVATGRNCEIEGKGFLARCRVDKGQVTVIADADFADVERRREPTRSENLEALIAELDKLR